MFFMSIAMIYIATLDLNFRRLQPFMMLCHYNPIQPIISSLAFIFVHGPPSLAARLELVPGKPAAIIFVTHRLLLYFFQLLSEIHY